MSPLEELHQYRKISMIKKKSCLIMNNVASSALSQNKAHD